MEKVFTGKWSEIEECREALKLYASAVASYAERHGPITNTAWTKAGFSAELDNDPEEIGDNIRDAHVSANALVALIAKTSSNLGLDLPASPSDLKEWIRAVERLPSIPERHPPPTASIYFERHRRRGGAGAGAFGARRENARRDTTKRSEARLPARARRLRVAGLMDLSPDKSSLRPPLLLKESLIEGLQVFSRLVAVFRPSSVPDVNSAHAMAVAVNLAGRSRRTGYVSFGSIG